MEHIIHINEKGIVNKSVVKKAFEVTPGRYILKLTKSNKRSLPQNAFYWGVCVPLVKDGLKEIGYNDVRTTEDAHEVLKYLFLKKKIGNSNTGEVIEFLGSTASLTTIEFMEYIVDIQQWAAEFLGIQVPSPNEQLEFFDNGND